MFWGGFVWIFFVCVQSSLVGHKNKTGGLSLELIVKKKNTIGHNKTPKVHLK